MKAPAIPAWHEPCSSPYIFLWSAGREIQRQSDGERMKKIPANLKMISICAWASSYWSSSYIPYGASQRLRTIQEESGGSEADSNNPTAPHSTKTHTWGALSGAGGCCALQLQKILVLDSLKNMLCTHQSLVWSLIDQARAGVVKRNGRKRVAACVTHQPNNKGFLLVERKTCMPSHSFQGLNLKI